MRASELKLPQGMEVYVDMDGVLADFFSEYAKLAGIESGNYRDIPPAKADPTLNKMIGTDFFYRLPKFPTADKLLDIVVDAAGSYNICSSPLRGDHENSGVQKRRWIEKHLAVKPKNIFIVANKAKYAVNANGMPNVLIDDRGSNISSWEAAGGIGIKYQADEDTLKKVLDGLKRARRVGQGEEQHEPQQLISKDRGGSNAIATAKDESIEESRRSGFYSVHKFLTKYNRFDPIGSPTKFSGSAVGKTLDYLKQTNMPVKVTINDHKGEFDSVIIEPGDHVKRAVERLGFIDDSPDVALDVKEGKVKLFTDPDYFGAEVDDTGFDSLPIVNIPTTRLVGFEPDSKMQEPKSKANVKKILAGLAKGDNIPPILVRKHKNGYQVLDGHHRFWAYKVAKKDSIPARVVDPKDIEEVGKQGVAENFADGKGPGRPGDSQRHGIPKKATMAELEKASHAKGRKGQLARWQINMRRGRKK